MNSNASQGWRARLQLVMEDYCSRLRNISKQRTEHIENLISVGRTTRVFYITFIQNVSRETFTILLHIQTQDNVSRETFQHKI